MTLLHNDPQSFADEALEGFTAAHEDLVRAVHGGVVRATVTPPGQVAVVLGGGTGHYPAFAGWVGPGFAHGAVCGNIFASPSASQVCSVARAAHADGGLILSFGNYAGDVLQFGRAAGQLRDEGIDVRTVRVTDDIASGPADDTGLRRGIAGDLPVMKILGAAAESGRGIDEVERIGRKANAATRSFGVAFSGCSLPGAGHPLFTVPPGRMAVGLGIHGEPGIGERVLPSADAIADILVDRLLTEAPQASAAAAGTDRAAVLLNGLGATKYEELYVVFRRVSTRIAGEGLQVVSPEVGEHVTSLGMAGLSLTVTFLDEELETLWTAPAHTPAFRRGALTSRPLRAEIPADTRQLPPVVPGGEASHAFAVRIADAMRVVRNTVAAQEVRLGDIDAVAGDGDHGIGMRRGAEAAADAAEEAVARGAGARTTLDRAGAAWSQRAGGTSGALWGAGLTAFGSVLDDTDRPEPARLAAGVRAAVGVVLELGGAVPGDKTLVDAAVPFAERLEAALPRTGFRAAWAEAAEAATNAAEATATITARVGRARTHGERSLGTPDAGAVSFALIVTALGDAVRSPSKEKSP